MKAGSATEEDRRETEKDYFPVVKESANRSARFCPDFAVHHLKMDPVKS